MRIYTHENRARLLFHLNAYSVIQISDLPAAPLWEISTRLLSFENRIVNAEFRIRWNAISPEPHDTIDELREALHQFIEILD
ncbi:hypothetical protein LOC67_22680 [Stieleria sp. JC731]|uniref:hypothetical protein n=1 Tax=Stieleria sp. JC731 TaxID=2894195 RepID=UPI001E344623|nr:hypothetical protein [Stieleria sp. JC731]MCC9603365.1 hypothetical protein [Stieleria sp. JC731]